MIYIYTRITADNITKGNMTIKRNMTNMIETQANIYLSTIPIGDNIILLSLNGNNKCQ